MIGPQMCTVAAAAKMGGVTRSAVYGAIARGSLTPVMIHGVGPRRQMILLTADVEAYFAAAVKFRQRV